MASEYEKDRQAKLEALKVYKQKTENIVPEKEKTEIIKPKTFKEKWENYWYHNKIPTFIGAIAVIFVVTLLWNMLSKPSFDATFTIVTESAYDGSESFVENKLLPFIDDVDGNGKKKILVESYYIIVGKSGAAAETVQMNRAKLIAKLNKNDAFLYMVDGVTYQDMKDLGVVFKDLTDISDSNRVDGDRYSLKDTNFAKALQLSDSSDEMYLCLIDYDGFAQKDKESIKEIYNNDMALLKSIIAYN